MSDLAIAASGLHKAYGDKVVLEGIDLEVRAGTVFSLLGPNGAGKTTTVNVLTTLTKANSGTVRVAGHDVVTAAKSVCAVIGVTGQFAAVDELLTGQENLQLMTPRCPRSSRCWRGRTAPQAHGFAQQPDSPGTPHLASLSDEALEPHGIHSIGVHRQPVAACLPLDQPFRQRLAQPGNQTLQGVRRVGRRVLTPDPIDERRLRDYAICFEREGG
jgi:energy-coupling factor transporter ATP-binding protein EcfA2